ncbi:hypothetical protein D3C77_54610 [compost metagenome]
MGMRAEEGARNVEQAGAEAAPFRAWSDSVLKTLAIRAGVSWAMCFKSYVERAAATELPSGDVLAEQLTFVLRLRSLGEVLQIGLGNDKMS